MVVLSEIIQMKRQIDRLQEKAMVCRERAMSSAYRNSPAQSGSGTSMAEWIESAVDYDREADKIKMELSSMIIDLRCEMAKMSPVQAAVVQYVYLDGMTIGEAADSVGISYRHASKLSKNFSDDILILV